MTTEVRISPVEQLKEEHQSVLKLLTDTTAIMASVDRISPDQWQAFFDKACAYFLKEVAIHFKKEEEALFPAMEKHLGQGAGPIAVMLSEHQQHYQLLDRLCTAVKARDLDAIRDIWGHFNPLLTMHIMKEDNVLFPMAGNLLDEAEWSEVSSKMAALNCGLR